MNTELNVNAFILPPVPIIIIVIIVIPHTDCYVYYIVMIRCDVLIKCMHTISNSQCVFRIEIEKELSESGRERTSEKKPITIRCKGCGYLNVFSTFICEKNRFFTFFFCSAVRCFTSIRSFFVK